MTWPDMNSRIQQIMARNNSWNMEHMIKVMRRHALSWLSFSIKKTCQFFCFFTKGSETFHRRFLRQNFPEILVEKSAIWPKGESGGGGQWRFWTFPKIHLILEIPYIKAALLKDNGGKWCDGEPKRRLGAIAGKPGSGVPGRDSPERKSPLPLRHWSFYCKRLVLRNICQVNSLKEKNSGDKIKHISFYRKPPLREVAINF